MRQPGSWKTRCPTCSPSPVSPPVDAALSLHRINCNADAYRGRAKPHRSTPCLRVAASALCFKIVPPCSPLCVHTRHGLLHAFHVSPKLFHASNARTLHGRPSTLLSHLPGMGPKRERGEEEECTF